MNKTVEKVQGPVIPLPIPFHEDDSIAYDALAEYVNFLCEKGIPNLMTTIGTSRYNVLNFDEIRKVNETVVKAAKGRAVTIVSNPQVGGTKHSIDFAKHAESIGADFFLVYFPERDYGDEFTIPFFKRIHDESNIDILIHEMPFRSGLGPGNYQYSISMLNELLSFERIVGMKEEALDEAYSNLIVETFSKDAIIIGAGGGMSRYFYRDFSRGAKAFLGGLGNFIPEIELDFYQKMINGDQEGARRIVEDIEIPYFKKVVPIGWHPHLKAALAYKGLMPKWDRMPMKMLSQEELKMLEEAIDSI